MHMDIPRVLSGKLNLFSEDQIVVDLTNGHKYISSILYASASLSEIVQLFWLTVDRDKQNVAPEKLKESDYLIKVFPSIENLESIEKYTYFEITCYRETTQKLLEYYSRIDFYSSYLNNMFVAQIEAGISTRWNLFSFVFLLVFS